jgi:hypothetical protein
MCVLVVVNTCTLHVYHFVKYKNKEVEFFCAGVHPGTASTIFFVSISILHTHIHVCRAELSHIDRYRACWSLSVNA